MLAGWFSLIALLPLFQIIYYPFVPLDKCMLYSPDAVLNKISKIIRKFFWSRCGNHSGVHSVMWNSATLDKADGGLGIQISEMLKFL